MSLIALGMNLMLAGLLAAALMMGFRLNGRLKHLRDSHDGFAKAVAELDVAAARAEQGLADLRAATDEATDALADRIEKLAAAANPITRDQNIVFLHTGGAQGLFGYQGEIESAL